MMNVDALYRRGPGAGFMTGTMNELPNWIFQISVAVHVRYMLLSLLLFN